MDLLCGLLCSLLPFDSDIGPAGDAAKFGSGLADAVTDELADAVRDELHNSGSFGVVTRGRTSGRNCPSASWASRPASCDGGVQLSSLSSAVQQSADHFILT